MNAYQRAIEDANEWLRNNIATAQDPLELAEMLDIAARGGFNSRCSNVSDVINQCRPGLWTPTVRAANEILKKRYGRLWNYTGD